MDEATVLTPCDPDLCIDNQLVISNGYKSWFFIDEEATESSDGETAEIMINFGEIRTPHTLFLLNNCYDDENQTSLGSSEVRVGNDEAAFSTDNAVVKSDIVEGGFHELDLTSGQFL